VLILMVEVAFALSHFGSVWCYRTPHLPVPGTSPPTDRPAERHTAWRAWRAWCGAPWTVAPVSLLSRHMSRLTRSTRARVQALVLLSLLLRSCMVMSFPPPASLYLVSIFLACQNSCHGLNYLRIFACLVLTVAQ
jgi:hypothetical protein